MELDKIITGNSAVVLQSFPPDCIDLTVTSPPYDNLRTYNGFTFDFETIAKELFRVTKAGGVVVWVVSDETLNGCETLTSFRQALFFQSVGFNVETMIWNKPPQGANGSNWYYPQSHEYMFILAKGKPSITSKLKDRRNAGWGRSYEKTRGGKNTKTGARKTGEVSTVDEFGYRTNVWNVKKESSGNSHPAPFPEDLARDHILSWSKEGDIVLDCFCGSGTTPKMARLLNRHWIGIEISPEFAAMAQQRVVQLGRGLTPPALDRLRRDSVNPLQSNLFAEVLPAKRGGR
jgi:DNA modification methylase